MIIYDVWRSLNLNFYNFIDKDFLLKRCRKIVENLSKYLSFGNQVSWAILGWKCVKDWVFNKFWF